MLPSRKHKAEATGSALPPINPAKRQAVRRSTNAGLLVYEESVQYGAQAPPVIKSLKSPEALARDAAFHVAKQAHRTQERTLLHRGNIKQHGVQKKDAAMQRLLQSRRQREQFRRKLVDAILVTEDPNEEEHRGNSMFTAAERKKLRYYYYIHNGINTEHVAPLATSWLDNILCLVPKHLKVDTDAVISELCLEVRKNYLFCVKKAIGERTANDPRPIENSMEVDDGVVQPRKVTPDVVPKTCRTFARRLHVTSPCLQQIHDLWCKTYKDFVMVNLTETRKLKNALELSTVMQIINSELDQAKIMLNNKWLASIEAILVQGIKRHYLPPTTRRKKLDSYFEAVSTLMCNHLQQMCLKSIFEVTDYLCGQQQPGFILRIILEEDSIRFDPSILSFEVAFLSIYDAMVSASYSLPRIEQKLYPDLVKQGKGDCHLRPIILEEIIAGAKGQVTSTIQEESIKPKTHAEEYKKYDFIINNKINEDVDLFLSANHPFSEFAVQVEQYTELAKRISIDMIRTRKHGLFVVHCTDLIQALIRRTDSAREKLLQRMMKNQQDLCAKLCKDYDETSTKALSQPANTAELMDLKEYVEEVETTLIFKMEDVLRDVCTRMNFLVDYVTFSPAEIRQNNQTFQWYSKLPDVIKECKQTLTAKRNEFEETLRQNRLSFIDELDEYAQQVGEFTLLSDMKEMNHYLKKAQDLNEKLETSEAKIKQFNTEEDAFGWAITEYPQRKQTLDKLSPYLKLYETSVRFEQRHREWLDSPLTVISPENVEQEIGEFWKSIYKLERLFIDIQTIKVMIQKMKSRVEELKEHLPLVHALCNPGLRDRHWEQIGEVVGFPLKADQETTLAKIIDLNLDEFVSRFEAISESASKEHNLERALQKMIQEWETMCFCIITYRETGTFILASIDDIQQLLDDHIVKTQSMKSSPFVKPFEKEITQWTSKLARLQEIVDEWLRVQTTWMYLEPIFTSPDIMTQMPEEGRRFNTVDKHWRDIMKTAVIDKHVLIVLKIERILERLKKSNDLLDLIQKGLNEYLERKRLCFPRFFFLSNDELLEILSETKDPTRVQPHLRKCFEGVAKLKFEENLEVTEIISSEGEIVVLDCKVATSKARGQVELWLGELEHSMVASVQQMINDALEAYPKKSRVEWIFDWAGQGILCVTQLIWTAEVHKALTDGAKNLKSYLTETTDRINNAVELVRRPLAPQQRITLGALVVLDVHARDIVANLVKKEVTSVEDFHWLSQLRYYIEEGCVSTAMINSSLQYGYEYLGNTGRLVITPLTDKCYRSVFSALRLHLGCAPEGPAGTGKTETTKDLAKAVAKHCVVFNCSDDMDYISLGKFFKGLAACGAWSCFDEFNRIDLEVLSVVAQQILTIQRGIHANSGNLVIGGTEVKLNPTCAVFVTMNPGYAGRSELPDNLKALFRPVAMMVPDYAMIAEIALYSYGFVRARHLAVKIVLVYRLCAEQLSSQCHYDYGMRAIKSVLTAVGKLKIENASESEDVQVLRALKNVNLPKFLPMDVPLFNAITSDLFPGIQLSDVDFSILDREIGLVCRTKNLQCTEHFLEKIHQVYETIAVRHGLMIVGGPLAGKNSVYKVLAEALGNLHDKKRLNENKVQITVINPKAVSMGRLYGQFDPLSHEWTDGILPLAFRNYATSSSPDRKWIIFDGPVDAVWIENMNTVLDDNKKLCLMSGEVIQMSQSMNLIFLTLDLQNASPATVSRCGMIYMEPSLLGWKPIIQSWINTWPSFLTDQHKAAILKLFDYFCPPLLYFLRHAGLKELATTSDIALVISLSKLMDCFLENLNEGCYFKTLGSTEIHTFLACGFIFSCAWSIGGNLDEDSRAKFDVTFRSLMNVRDAVVADDEEEENDVAAANKVAKEAIETTKIILQHILVIPNDGLIYDYKFSYEGKRQWMKWSEYAKQAPPIPRDILAHQIIVPTADTICYTHLLSILIANNKPTIFVGPSGCGKTMIVMDYFNNKLSSDYKSAGFNFTARLTSTQTQEIVMSKLDKRRKGLFGPPINKKLIMFIDDLNLPIPEAHGAQPPIELLRHWLSHGTWNDARDSSLIKIFDVQMVAAMGPTGGGRNTMSPRFLRHYNVISINKCSVPTMRGIFSKIILWHLDTRGFSKDFDPAIEQLVSGALDIHRAVTEGFLPTPAKCHYVFNLRDISHVLQGVLLSVPETMEDLRAMKRLWSHEILRVYYDRLVDVSEKAELMNQLRKTLKEALNEDFDQLFLSLDSDGDGKVSENDLRNLIFCDFSDPKSDARNYVEVPDLDNLRSVVEGYLEEYNNVSKKPMNLVMFRFAIEHLSRISRIIKQPQGHALLVGVGGSGRQSLTRLVGHIADYEIHQLEITRSYTVADWKDDLKHILIKTASDEKHHIFLLTDAQISEEVFLDDVNNLLSTGDIPNLFNSEEVTEISDKMREVDRQREKPVNPDGDKASMFQLFIQTIRNQLHIVFATSPAGNDFRDRLRKFPSLVSCCTVVWFQPWPEDALQAVAYKFLSTLGLDASEQDNCAVLCQMLHTSTQELSKEFLDEMKRATYVTPASYLELLGTYKALLTDQREDVMKSKKRYEMGIEKLDLASTQVITMQNELSKLQPLLIEASKEVDVIMAAVEKESLQVAEVEKIVKIDEEQANEQARTAGAIKEDCDRELSTAIPVLDAAIDALNTLTNNDITIVKTMKNPPSGVKLVMESICILKEIKCDRITDPNGSGKMVDDYWGPSKKILGEMKFLEYLKNFDKDNIPSRTMKVIREKYIVNPDFDPEKIKAASAAAEGLCKWVVALEAYDRVIKEVAPKREALALAEAELGQAQSALREKQAALKEVQEKVQQLTDVLERNKRHKMDLEVQVDQCTLKLERAQQLLNRLGGEKSRWNEMAIQLGEKYDFLTGDMLVASGIIAYLGPYTASYRQTQIQSWLNACEQLKLKCSPNFSLANSLGDPVTIQAWKIAELPVDAFSVDNAIIIYKSHRWPLIIDPQNQANRWIHNMEKGSGLKVLKPTDSDYLRNLEVCIQTGKPVLLESIGCDVDPALESVLLKQTFKHGTTLCMKVGENIVEYNVNFRLYLTSNMSNPHYLPEAAMKVALINFMITPSGLEDQLLGLVVAREKPDLEDERRALIVQSADNKKQLKEIEDRILEVLSTSQGNILDDETAIKVLSSSKILANEILQKQANADVTEKKIEDSRQGYKPITIHASNTFFTVTSLSSLDHMYMYSLPWFVSLFTAAIDNTEKLDELGPRLAILKEYFTQTLHENICRGLFQKDKLLFTFLLAVNELKLANQIDDSEWQFLLVGGSNLTSRQTANPIAWLPQNVWDDICALAELTNFAKMKESITVEQQIWREFYENSEDESDGTLPLEWEGKLNKIQKLLVFRCLCPYKVIPSIRVIIAETLGAAYIEELPFDMSKAFADSSCCSPIIFMLTPGVDPIASLFKFAEEMGFGGSRIYSLSLGQGQGPIAVDMVQEASKVGLWVVLQNCHLAKSWMPALEKLLEDMSPDSTHPDFRLWLTTYSCDYFPMSLLQMGIKITDEAVSGLRASMTRAYLSDPIANPDVFYGCRSQPKAFQKLIFGLCLFHTVVKERRNFGSLGWNMPYEFSETDLLSSLEHLNAFLHESESVPMEALLYTIGVCTYGGRVTDTWDVRTVKTLLKKFVSDEFLTNDEFHLGGNVHLTLPTEGRYEEYLELLKALPATTLPEILGLHSNARIVTANAEAMKLLQDILQTQLGVMESVNTGSQVAKSSDEVITDFIRDILSRLPAEFDMESAYGKKFPDDDACMKTVLIQELDRCNALLRVVKRSLRKTQQAVKGQIVMSKELEEVAAAILKNKVPNAWLAKSYLSVKPLGSYVLDFQKRLQFLKEWYEQGSPTVFWISGMFFVQSFLTAVIQSYSRKNHISIDFLDLDCEILREDKCCPTSAPETGVYIRGLFLEGARWNTVENILSESHPNQLYDTMPTILLKPVLKAEVESDPQHTYLCPVYQTSQRWGQLSTTGHSTNYMLSLRLPSSQPEEHWTCRGVALLCQLDH